jgi:hypothetical protein
MRLATKIAAAFREFQKGSRCHNEHSVISGSTTAEIHARVAAKGSMAWPERKQTGELEGCSPDSIPVIFFWAVFDQLIEGDK